MNKIMLDANNNVLCAAWDMISSKEISEKYYSCVVDLQSSEFVLEKVMT